MTTPTDTFRSITGDEVHLSFYEAKMMHQFDHCRGTYEGHQSDDEARKGYCREPSGTDYSDPTARRYTPELLDFIVPRVVELAYTAWDLQDFAQDVLAEVGLETWARWFEDALIHTSPPPEWAAPPTPALFIWNEARRAILRAGLDGLYAHLYGLTRAELAHILDTFTIVRRKDEG
jgi:hypothetical protein